MVLRSGRPPDAGELVFEVRFVTEPSQAEHRRSGRQDHRTAEEVRVLAAVIRGDRGLLLCRRPAHKRHGGLWEFPGGKIEPGESRLDAARRELREELGVDVLAVAEAPLLVRGDPGSPFVIEFVETRIGGEPRALEHEEVRWVPAEAVARLDLAPADRAFVQAGLGRSDAAAGLRAAADAKARRRG